MTFWGKINKTYIYIYIYFLQEFGITAPVLGGGDTRDIAEPTYKTFNLHTRLSTDRIQDFQPTYKTFNKLLDKNPTAYKTFNLPTRQISDRIQDFQLTYKAFNKLLYKNPTAYKTFNLQTRVSTYQLGFKPKN